MKNKIIITYIFLALCLIISVPGAFFPAYFELFSSELPHDYWWQYFSNAFLHGVKGRPVVVLLHLALNMVLLLFCGRIAETLLGRIRFLLLTILALGGFVLTQWLSGVWINGASGVIWAYSPFLLAPIRAAKQDTRGREQAEQAAAVLVIMWGMVTVMMGFVPLIFNPKLNLAYTYLYGNLFHAAATFIGFVMYFVWKGWLRDPEILW